MTIIELNFHCSK